MLNKAFILGFPRSGTTWFANILNTHPDIIYRHEFLGREYSRLPEEIFSRLKSKKNLSSTDKQYCLNELLKPQINADKPPFFDKNHYRYNNPILQYYIWLIAKSVPPLKKLYQAGYYPMLNDSTWLLCKETRSSKNMIEMMSNLDVDKVYCLIRDPLSVIASFSVGIKKGIMKEDDIKARESWYDNNQTTLASIENCISKHKLLACPYIDYLAWRWCAYYQDMLDLADNVALSTFFIQYESVLEQQEQCVERLFKVLSLSPSGATQDFLNQNPNSKQLSQKDAGSDYFSVLQKPQKDKWKSILSAGECEAIIKITGPTKNLLSDRFFL